VALGIEQSESREGVVEGGAHVRIDARGARLSRELLLAHAFTQRRASGLVALGWNGLGVQIDAGLAATIAARRRG
jgi:hypothetical protein